MAEVQKVKSFDAYVFFDFTLCVFFFEKRDEINVFLLEGRIATLYNDVRAN